MRVLLMASLWKLRNALLTTLTDPRKLIPIVIFGGFLLLQTLGASMLWMGRLGPTEDIGHYLVENMRTIDAAVFLTLALFSAGIIDAGFGGGSLVFPMADVDYLFPAPFSRRLLLAFKLPGATARFMVVIALLLGVFQAFVVRPIESLPAAHSLPVGTATLALVLYVGTYVNLAVAVELVFGLGRAAWLRRVILAGVATVSVVVGLVIWQMRGAGVEAIGSHPLLTVLFYPARLAAGTLTGPLAASPNPNGLWILAAFYLASLGLLFSRRESYYEAAAAGSERASLLRKAAQEQNWSVILGTRQAGGRDGSLSVRPFGRGAMALFWAHTAAAAKRPWANFAAPVLGGLALTGTAWVLRDRDFNVLSLVMMGVGYYLFYAVLLLGVPFFRRSLMRYPLMRPLPMPAWQVVAADVAPRVVLTSLFALACGATLPLTGLPRSGMLGTLLVLCLPVMLVPMNLIQLIVAMWYPNPQDKVQTMVAGFLQMLATGVLSGVLLGFLSVPLATRAPLWTGILSFWLAALGSTALLMILAVAVFRAYEPTGDTT